MFMFVKCTLQILQDFLPPLAFGRDHPITHEQNDVAQAYPLNLDFLDDNFVVDLTVISKMVETSLCG